MSLLLEIVTESFRMLLLAAPFLLLGLLLAGFLHVLMPTALIQRWLGRAGMTGVVRAALIGVPLPVCSCGVVPIAIEMRRKGASKPASLSFLTTTPESSIDSIIFTWGLLGPFLAIMRPIAAFFTAVIGGVLAIAYLDDDRPGAAAADDGEAADCHHDHCHHGHGEHDHTLGNVRAEEARAALRGLWLRLVGRFVRRRPKSEEFVAAPPSTWRALIRPALRYGFVELLDDLVFWLLLGIGLAGVLSALMPDDLATWGLGGGLLPMLLILVVSVPMYMCASASTPVAAALLAKGISPGAALVFLLAGPATNAATVLLLAKTLGRRFVQIYVLSVVVGALISGLVLDLLVTHFALRVVAPLAFEGEMEGGLILWLSLAVLAVLIVASLWRGAGRQGLRELGEGFAGYLPAPPARRRRAFRRLGLVVMLAAFVAYLATGLHVVPPDSHGYGYLFGALTRPDLPPGLHFVPPAPVGRWEVRRTGYARKADVGFRTDLDMLTRRKELALLADPDAWHSTVAAMNADPERAVYLTADENLLEMSFTVHFGLAEPTTFLFRLDHRHDLVGLYAEAAARELIAGNPFEALLTTRREEIEAAITASLTQRLEAIHSGIRVDAVRIVDIHPPADVVHAFRDVSSAREDRETRIHRAGEQLAAKVPRARGEAARIVAEATAAASSRATAAVGRAGAFKSESEAYRSAPEVLRHLLWMETLETVLSGREKIIVPPDAGADGSVTLWRDAPETTGR